VDGVWGYTGEERGLMRVPEHPFGQAFSDGAVPMRPSWGSCTSFQPAVLYPGAASGG
jgi:hypothetical protein